MSQTRGKVPKRPPPDTGLMEGGILYTRKKRLVKEKREREKPGKTARKKARKEARECFWIWPWGHIWTFVDEDDLADEICQVCEKVRAW